MSSQRTSEDSDAFLAELYLRLEERAAARYSASYDVADASARYRAWLSSKTVTAAPETPGLSLCPDPGNAKTAAEFMATLRNYRTWAGNPSYRAMQNVIKDRFSRPFAHSTIHAALTSDDLPALSMLQAIITACGGRDTHHQMFISAWRRLTMAQQDDAKQSPPHAIRPAGETA